VWSVENGCNLAQKSLQKIILMVAKNRANLSQLASNSLTHARADRLSHLEILHLIRDGFLLQDVRDMIASSELYASSQILQNITGKSSRTIRKLHDDVRLNAQQSAIAFQYAAVLSLALSVFGSQSLAEQWISRPCTALGGMIPFEMITNSWGFLAIKEYLERVELGIYQ
jgi:putative toxin-antitoxin system antitoxin component (TIGR02293 family)